MPNDNSASDDKEATTVEPPTRQQIDLVFATIVHTIANETNGPLGEPTAELIVTIWRTVRELADENNLTGEHVDVEKIAEEWL